MIPYKKVK